MFSVKEGDRFNRLTVIGPMIYQSTERKCECLCDCGEKVFVGIHKLRRGDTKSCGCWRRESIASIAHSRGRFTTDSKIARIMHTYKARAKKDNRLFTLTENEFAYLITQNCFYCDIRPARLARSSGKKSATFQSYMLYNGIDRVDNARGYELDNCVSCCAECNKAKSTMSQKEFIALCKRVTEKHCD
jgi:hypothetical protein